VNRCAPPVSVGARAVVLLTKVAVLTACALLRDREAQARYRHWRSWLDDRAMDPTNRVTARRLARECAADLRSELRDILGTADLASTIYHFVDQPMVGLLVAVPTGAAAGLLSFLLTGSAHLAWATGSLTAGGTWVLYIAFRVRQAINDDRKWPPPPAPGDPTRRITLPNAVSLARLVAGPPVIVWAVSVRRVDILVIAVAAFLASDWLDGYIARGWGQVTDLGRLLDRGADRVLTASLAFSLLVAGIGPPLLLALALSRDAVLAWAALVRLRSGERSVPVACAGKAGFALLISGLVLLLLPQAHLRLIPANGGGGRALAVVGSGMAAWGLALRYSAAFRYLKPMIDSRLRHTAAS
jgi:phosphatidylglycerophosphate synthase